MARDIESTRVEDAGGWIPLWRSWMRHPHYFTQEGREATSGEAFIDLLLRANYRTSFLIDRGEQLTIRPGQVLTSIHSLAERWKWSRSRVRRWIVSCSKRGEIYTKSDHRRTVITLCNFDKWRFVSSTGVTTDVTTDVTSDEPVTDTSEKGDKGNKGKRKSSPMPTGTGPIVAVFPTVGQIKEWECRQSLVDTLAEAYPGVDVVGEIKRARAWCVANPKNRKTAGGMARFLNRWLDRSQNQAKRNGYGGTIEAPKYEPQRSAEELRKKLGLSEPGEE